MENGKKYVAYYRTSTAKQQRSGLGLEAQREAVRQFLNGGEWSLVGEFTEKEKGNRNSGKRTDRPALNEALATCRIHNCALVVAKLDRLARNTEFLLSIVNGTGDAGVIFCDLPKIPEGPVGKFIVTQMASVAELEAGLTSQRTKAALQAAKKKGTILGCRNDNVRFYAAQGAKASATVRSAKAAKRRADLQPIIKNIQGSGITTLSGIAKELNGRKVKTTHGYQWTAGQVKRLLSA